MINITSNINEFFSRYTRKTNAFRLVMQTFAYKLAVRMSEDMKIMISSMPNTWKDEGNLSTINEVSFRPEIIGQNMVRVHIGENLPLIEMQDGSLVNPAFFIEFGFGILGEQQPKKNSEKLGWEYNIHHHDKAWFFKYNGELKSSVGGIGLNFIYITMQDYIIKWKEYFHTLLLEYINV